MAMVPAAVMGAIDAAEFIGGAVASQGVRTAATAGLETAANAYAANQAAQAIKAGVEAAGEGIKIYKDNTRQTKLSGNKRKRGMAGKKQKTHGSYTGGKTLDAQKGGSLKKKKTTVERKKSKKSKHKNLSLKKLDKRLSKVESNQPVSTLRVKEIRPWLAPLQRTGANRVGFVELNICDESLVSQYIKAVPISDPIPDDQLGGGDRMGHTIGRRVNFNTDNQPGGVGDARNKHKMSFFAELYIKNFEFTPQTYDVYVCEAKKNVNGTPLDIMTGTEERGNYWFENDSFHNNNNTDNPTYSNGPHKNWPSYYPTYHKDLMNTWAPRRVWSGTINGGSEICVRHSIKPFWYRHNWKQAQLQSQGTSFTYTDAFPNQFFLVRVEGTWGVTADGFYKQAPASLSVCSTLTFTLKYTESSHKLNTFDIIHSRDLNSTDEDLTVPGMNVIDQDGAVGEVPPIPDVVDTNDNGNGNGNGNGNNGNGNGNGGSNDP